MPNIPKSHPRYESLRTRDLIAGGVEKGIASIHGLIAHGRGEAFDYLIGEKTNDFAICILQFPFFIAESQPDEGLPQRPLLKASPPAPVPTSRHPLPNPRSPL